MSVSMAPSASQPAGSVSIFGRKISYDALLVAGAGLLGAFFLYKVGVPTGNLGAGSVAGDSSAGAGPSLWPDIKSTVPGLPSTSSPDPFVSGAPIGTSGGPATGSTTTLAAAPTTTWKPPPGYAPNVTQVQVESTGGAYTGYKHGRITYGAWSQRPTGPAFSNPGLNSIVAQAAAQYQKLVQGARPGEK